LGGSVLVVGHPGHELRVFGWLERTRAAVHVLTDGSGSRGVSRVDSTTAVLDAIGATRGSIYARMTDREIYQAILTHDHRRFTALADELAREFVEDDIAIVAGDAIEGFNPAHDVCRYVINAAVRLAATATNRPRTCYAFPLDGAPDGRSGTGEGLRLVLDDDTLERKLRAARTYPELRAEVDAAIDRFGQEPFRTEVLWRVDLNDRYGWDPTCTPFYERHGAARVQSGVYGDVVTFREHLRPLADALWMHSAG
jgi:hypothetical protein